MIVTVLVGKGKVNNTEGGSLKAQSGTGFGV